jgi:hypothetical protein
MHQLKERLATHEKKQHDAAEALILAKPFPDLLFCAGPDRSLNPAILCCMHASIIARSPKSIYLPAPDEVRNVSMGAQTQESEVSSTMETGEVWWLFDGPLPYLAEVFPNGEVPESRLPHLERRGVDGNPVARRLGGHRQYIKVMRNEPSMCLYSKWCGADLSSCTVTASFMNVEQATTSCMQDISCLQARWTEQLQEAD